MLIKKFLTDFDQKASSLGIESAPESPISFEQFIILLRHLNFLSAPSETVIPQEQEQVSQIWSLIEDKRNNEAKKHSLKVVLAALNGYKTKWMFSSHVQGAEDVSPLKTNTRIVEITQGGRKIEVELG